MSTILYGIEVWLSAFIMVLAYDTCSFALDTYSFHEKRRQFLNCRHINVLIFYCKYVISRLFQKWCSSGVVSTISCHVIIDFTGFSRTFQDTAVANEQYLYHVRFSPYFRLLVFSNSLKSIDFTGFTGVHCKSVSLLRLCLVFNCIPSKIFITLRIFTPFWCKIGVN